MSATSAEIGVFFDEFCTSKRLLCRSASRHDKDATHQNISTTVVMVLARRAFSESFMCMVLSFDASRVFGLQIALVREYKRQAR